MKIVQLKNSGAFKSTNVFMQTVKAASKGMDVAEMRRRCRVIDALEKANGDASVLLEDSDHATLVAAINDTPWAVADPELMEILDDAINAKAPD